MMSPGISRRSFLKASSALAAGAPLLGATLQTHSAEAKGPLIAYVGTFSSPLRDMLPTQVDLPPGNGRGRPDSERSRRDPAAAGRRAATFPLPS